MLQTEGIELFIEDQAFSPSDDSAPSPPFSPSLVSKLSPVSSLLTEGGGARSQVIRPLESLALYKSFRTLCS